ncbi:MAG TPA: helix-turn-helix domain-containing protein [Pyrinomonadaceae bacterium]|nr:helix-turn-helix domain-containing protein [Pyrinomonadaceae bacterium]
MNLQVSAQTVSKLGQDSSVLARCQEAKHLEMDGDYAGARAVLGELCEVLGERPNLEGLTQVVGAELLLRAGSICGWLGSAHQIENSQERAKDLISESRSVFEHLGLTEKAAEASNDLAICYWREGAYDEARATLRHVLAQLDQNVTEAKLRTFLNLAVVERSSMRWRDALEVNRTAAPAFERSSNHSLRGKFHNEYATVLKNLGLAESREDYVDQALVEYAAASYHLEQAGNRRFQAVTENNQALIFSSISRFSEAHEHLNRARSLFLTLNDRGHVAQVDETRARVLLAEGKISEAERIVRGSVKTLMQGDQRSILAEALTTHGVALARLERHDEARSAFKRAVEVADQGGDPETAGTAALTMVEELESYLGIEAKQFYVRAEWLLKKSQDEKTILRLGDCARRLLARETHIADRMGLGRSESPSSELDELLKDGPFSLEQRVLQFEGQLIKRALEASGGSVTKAARLLGISHQGLAFILNGRHKNLLAVRTPVRPRRKSIIRR